ncbi:threonyl-tRNA synthetase editing domain-containing protein [Alkaliflexus imshenetskii]|uniref:threonyl-tRNA synthetase editing domain-containing protein n=1 Tax=Alkaliflexus imshenetskii TaxID=286730 RepID=UPI000479FF6D|nr:threonyl-tRNA synthetase editing domain-containing protein [Alkaliflexus imshenetskii]
MKVLCFYTTSFSYTIGEKNHEEAIDAPCPASFAECIVAYIQVEEADELQDVKSREKKLSNHLKWVARKNGTEKIVLHSFAHLSSSKASMQFTRSLFDAALERLQNGGYQVSVTPFGYFLNLKMEAPGFSMARIWAEL